MDDESVPTLMDARLYEGVNKTIPLWGDRRPAQSTELLLLKDEMTGKTRTYGIFYFSFFFFFFNKNLD